jgi:hypothetical protein
MRIGFKEDDSSSDYLDDNKTAELIFTQNHQRTEWQCFARGQIWHGQVIAVSVKRTFG